MEDNKVVESGNNLEVAEPIIDDTTKNDVDVDNLENENINKDSNVDNTNDDNKNIENDKVKQTAEQNRIARDIRLSEKKKYETELNKKVQEAYDNGFKKAKNEMYLNQENPYTGKQIKDELDIEEYQTMLEIEKNGGDPLKDYGEKIKEKSRAEMSKRQKEQAERENQEKCQKDIDSFVEKYPDVNLNEMLKDNKFNKFIKGKWGNQPLTEIYEDYNELIGNFSTQAEDKAKKILANTKASPGSLSGGTNTEIDFENMPDEEFEKYEKAIASGRMRFKR